MSYENADCVTHSYGAIDFGAGSSSFDIKPPAGKRSARVVTVSVEATETFTSVTTPAYVRLGTAADPDKYVEMNLGTLAAGDTLAMSENDLKKRVIGLETDESVAQTLIPVNFVAPTGGSPAGIANVHLTLAWF